MWHLLVRYPVCVYARAAPTASETLHFSEPLFLLALVPTLLRILFTPPEAKQGGAAQLLPSVPSGALTEAWIFMEDIRKILAVNTRHRGSLGWQETEPEGRARHRRSRRGGTTGLAELAAWGLLQPAQPFPSLNPGFHWQGTSGPAGRRGAPAGTEVGAEVALASHDRFLPSSPAHHKPFQGAYELCLRSCE